MEEVVEEVVEEVAEEVAEVVVIIGMETVSIGGARMAVPIFLNREAVLEKVAIMVAITTTLTITTLGSVKE